MSKEFEFSAAVGVSGETGNGLWVGGCMTALFGFFKVSSFKVLIMQKYVLVPQCTLERGSRLSPLGREAAATKIPYQLSYHSEAANIHWQFGTHLLSRCDCAGPWEEDYRS